MSEKSAFVSGAAVILERINRVVLTVEKLLGGALMGFMLVVVVINILSRYVMAKPVTWGEELASFTFVWTALLSSAYALGREAHIRVTVITGYFSKRVQTVLEIVNYLVTIACVGIFLPYSIDALYYLTPSPAMRIPEQYFYCIVPIVFALFLFHQVVTLFRNLDNLKKGD